MPRPVITLSQRLSDFDERRQENTFVACVPISAEQIVERLTSRTRTTNKRREHYGGSTRWLQWVDLNVPGKVTNPTYAIELLDRLETASKRWGRPRAQTVAFSFSSPSSTAEICPSPQTEVVEVQHMDVLWQEDLSTP